MAGVYVRVFNQQPNFPLADPAAFCKVSDILRFIFVAVHAAHLSGAVLC